MDTLTITQRSGTLRTVQIDGESYNVSHLFCACADATVTLAPHKHDPKDSISVKIHCSTHGTLRAAAIKCGLTFACEPIRNDIVFAWAIERHNRDRRVAWGMKIKGSYDHAAQ